MVKRMKKVFICKATAIAEPNGIGLHDVPLEKVN